MRQARVLILLRRCCRCLDGGRTRAVLLRLDRGLLTIIQQNDGKRDDRDCGPGTEQNIDYEPHETDLFAGEKLLSA